MFDGVKIFMKITKNRSEKFLVKEQLPSDFKHVAKRAFSRK